MLCVSCFKSPASCKMLWREKHVPFSPEPVPLSREKVPFTCLMMRSNHAASLVPVQASSRLAAQGKGRIGPLPDAGIHCKMFPGVGCRCGSLLFS